MKHLLHARGVIDTPTVTQPLRPLEEAEIRAVLERAPSEIVAVGAS